MANSANVVYCARCAIQRHARWVVGFGYRDRDYELALCESHANAMDAVFGDWARGAVEVFRDDETVGAQPQPRPPVVPFPPIVREPVIVRDDDEPVSLYEHREGSTYRVPRKRARLVYRDVEYDLGVNALARMDAREITHSQVAVLLGNSRAVHRPFPGVRGLTVHASDSRRLWVVTHDLACLVTTVGRSEEDITRDVRNDAGLDDNNGGYRRNVGTSKHR